MQNIIKEIIYLNRIFFLKYNKNENVFILFNQILFKKYEINEKQFEKCANGEWRCPRVGELMKSDRGKERKKSKIIKNKIKNN